MQLSGKTIGLVGALAAFPRRVAAREVAAHDGMLRHGITRKTDLVVFGQKLLKRQGAAAVEAHFGAVCEAGKPAIGERAFLRLIAGEALSSSATLTREGVCAQSGLAEVDVRLLALFDAFEGDGDLFTFADAILARKYAGLIASGSDWFAIARSVHGAGPVASLTAYALHKSPHGRVYAERDAVVSELDGQTVLPLEVTGGEDPDVLFEAAEDAEADGDLETAVTLYRQCLSADPEDSVAAFNLANCLGPESDDARHFYALALKRDPTFVEAWFNLAGVLRARGDRSGAQAHLQRAIAIDPEYADAIYNLATLAFDAGDFQAARAGWSRYLALDPQSTWAETAAKGIRYIDLKAPRPAVGSS